MTDLRELRVLVVEDDFLQADCTQRELESAGAHVVGPCRDATAALEALRREKVDCALLDVSLYDGVSYDIATALIARQAPTIFVTGYSPDQMPDRLKEIEHLQKPVMSGALARAVARACGRGA